MANRVLLGKHPTHGMGLYVSKKGSDVTAITELDEFAFTTKAATIGQLVSFSSHTVAGASGGTPGTTSFTQENFGKDLLVIAYEGLDNHLGSGHADVDERHIGYKLISTQSFGGNGFSSSGMLVSCTALTGSNAGRSQITLTNYAGSSKIACVLLYRDRL